MNTYVISQVPYGFDRRAWNVFVKCGSWQRVYGGFMTRREAIEFAEKVL